MNGPAMVRAAIEAAEPFRPGPESTEESIARLAALSPPEYDRIRGTQAKRLEIRLSTLDAEVDKARRDLDGRDGSAPIQLANDVPTESAEPDTGVTERLESGEPGAPPVGELTVKPRLLVEKVSPDRTVSAFRNLLSDAEIYERGGPCASSSTPHSRAMWRSR